MTNKNSKTAMALELLLPRNPRGRLRRENATASPSPCHYSTAGPRKTWGKTLSGQWQRLVRLMEDFAL
jgi:hypothetical protein